VVKWSDLRTEKLQQYKCISRWLDAREQDLKLMESRDVTDVGGITQRINELNYCAKDLLELQRYLIDLRQMVAATLQDGDDKGERVLIQLESYEDRLDALKQIVEVGVPKTLLGWVWQKAMAMAYNLALKPADLARG